MTYKVKDHYFNKAKEQGFKARSVFKLEEIDQKYRILKAKDHVLDLGAAPGSWSQYISKKIGPEGILLGIDLTPIDLKLSNSHFIQADILKSELNDYFIQFQMREKMDCVVSDMAPKTTGIRSTDQARSHELCEMALKVALERLKKGGHFVCKYFQGEDLNLFQTELKKHFNKVELVKPKGTRTRSFEIFFVGLSKKT